MRKYLSLFFVVFLFGCKNNDNVEEKINKIPVKVEVVRFDKELLGATKEDLPKLKKEFPLFFPEQYPDETWINMLGDTIQRELLNEVGKTFPEFDEEKQELKELFQHVKYYFPEFNIPKVITLTTEVDYKNSIIYSDSLLLVGLDNYLGPGHKFYTGIQEYIKQGFRKKYMVVDAASKIARHFIRPPADRTFLSSMILYGKELYLKDLFIPHKPDAEKIEYPEDRLKWAEENEAFIWRYMVDGNLLFDTDDKLKTRLIEPSPFSKFYMDFDQETPGRIGQFIGWQIVRSYMDNNNVSLHEMLNKSTEEIFTNSKYKPKK